MIGSQPVLTSFWYCACFLMSYLSKSSFFRNSRKSVRKFFVQSSLPKIFSLKFSIFMYFHFDGSVKLLWHPVQNLKSQLLKYVAISRFPNIFVIVHLFLCFSSFSIITSISIHSPFTFQALCFFYLVVINGLFTLSFLC